MLKKYIYISILLSASACPTFAQFTTVTAAVQDPSGIPYAGAVLNAVLVPSTGGGYTLSGQPYSGRIGPVTLDSAGKFTVNFGDVTLITPGSPQWQITIDSAAATIGLPLGTGPQTFTFTSSGTTISGSSPVSLTSALNAVAPKLTNFASSGSSVTAVTGILPIVSSGGLSPAISCPGCSTTINAMTVSGAKRDGHPITYTTNSSGVVTSITSGNCSASDIGKNLYASYGSGANNLSAPFGAIATCTPGVTMTLSGGVTFQNAAVTAAGFIGTDDLAAINSCLAAAYAAGGTCYLPGGGKSNPYWLSANITDPGATNAYVFAGDSIDSTRIVYPPFNSTGLFLNANNLSATYRDFEVDPGVGGAGTPTQVSTCTQSPMQMNARGYRYAMRNVGCTGAGGQACIAFGTDEIQSSQLETSGCQDGIVVSATGMVLDKPSISATRTGLHNNDASTVVLGGNIGGGSQDVLADVQGGPTGFGTIYITDVVLQQSISGFGINTVNGSTVWVKGGIVGGAKGCSTTNPDSAINIVSGATVHTYGAQLCSNSTGTTITNAGAWYDDGGNIYPVIGAQIYSGSSGTVNGRSFLTGSAYSNSTTSFTAVTGSSGEPFAWHVNANEPLSVTCHLYYQAAATGGLNIEFTGPASPTSLAYGLNDPNAATTFNTAVATSFGTSLGQAVSTATTNFDAVVSLSMLNGTTAGTVTLLAKSSAAAALTIQPGSYCQSQ